MTSEILLIMGSTRAGRRCPAIAGWVGDIARASAGLECELVDLALWHLPMDDEPGLPQRGDYAQPHTRAWSGKIAQARGFVVVTPQYNWGIPAPLKNAIDHLHAEWRGKPLVIVSYGGHGGGRCASQLAQVAGAVRLRVMPTMPAITLAEAVIRGAPLDPGPDLAAQAAPVASACVELAAALAGNVA